MFVDRVIGAALGTEHHFQEVRIRRAVHLQEGLANLLPLLHTKCLTVFGNLFILDADH